MDLKTVSFQFGEVVFIIGMAHQVTPVEQSGRTRNIFLI